MSKIKITSGDIPKPKPIIEHKKFELDNSKIKPTNPITKPELNVYTIEETKDAVKALCALGNAINASLADDGKISFGDYPKFIGPVLALPAAISGIGDVPKELADLAPEEKEELVQLVKDELELGEKSEAVTEKILNIIYQIKDFVDFVK